MNMIETIQKPCPSCTAPFVSRDPTACHTWRSKRDVWVSCTKCDSAVLYSCPCGWTFLNGMNPKNPRTDQNERNRPDWMPDLAIDVPELPDMLNPEPQPGQATHSSEGRSWTVDRLIELSKDLPIKSVPVNSFNEWREWQWDQNLTLTDFLAHMRRVLDADLAFPIILSSDGHIMDGCHRLVKARLNGDTMILSKQFETDPDPEWLEDSP